MASKIYHACKAICVKAHGQYASKGVHICEFFVSDETSDKFIKYLEDNNNILLIDSAYIHCYRQFKGNDNFWYGKFSKKTLNYE